MLGRILFVIKNTILPVYCRFQWRQSIQGNVSFSSFTIRKIDENRNSKRHDESNDFKRSSIIPSLILYIFIKFSNNINYLFHLAHVLGHILYDRLGRVRGFFNLIARRPHGLWVSDRGSLPGEMYNINTTPSSSTRPASRTVLLIALESKSSRPASLFSARAVCGASPPLYAAPRSSRYDVFFFFAGPLNRYLWSPSRGNAHTFTLGDSEQSRRREYRLICRKTSMTRVTLTRMDLG